MLDTSTVTTTDPFAPISHDDEAGANVTVATEVDTSDAIEPIMPAPLEPPDAAHLPRRDGLMASASWTYRNADGAPLFVVIRYDMRDGGKDVLPYTVCRRVQIMEDGTRHERMEWRFKAPPALTPLYGLDQLAARPDAPVVVVEGEKTADAAALLFPDYVVVTSQGGANSAGKANWSVLAGRTVTNWPDNDPVGATYANDVAKLSREAGAASVAIVDIPKGWPDGWDVADPHPDGLADAEALRMLGALLESATPAGVDVVVPKDFRFIPDGLYFFPQPTERNQDPSPMFVAAEFEILGEANDGAGNDWGVVIRWKDRDERSHTWCVPKRMVHADGSAIAAELERAGLQCATDPRGHQLLKTFLGAVRTSNRLNSVDRSGWHEVGHKPAFILPGGEAYGPAKHSVIMQTEQAGSNSAFAASGSLQEWQQQVARYAVDNDRVALFVSAAFVGPLLDIASEPSGGIHLVGKSQSGKSTATFVAGSVWGRGDRDGQVRQWRATANGLEGIAAETSDTVLILDEMGQANANEVAETIYMLANGSGKIRAGRGGEARRRKTWRVLFLSTGEVTLAAKIAEAGKRVMAGQEVRLVNLPADAGADLGVFQQLHDKLSGAALANHLRDAARTFYGTASRAFLAKLAQDRAENLDGLRDWIAKQRNVFVDRHVPATADGQVRSVAGRFALIGVAGELARVYGVLPWPEGEAMRAAGACFDTWLAERGGPGAGEDTLAIAKVRAFIEAHGTSRFEEVRKDGDVPLESRTLNRAGFRRNLGDAWQYWILSEAWKSEVCRGLDPKRAADTLAARGLLIGATGRHRSAKVRVPGHGEMRVYIISGAILGDDSAE